MVTRFFPLLALLMHLQYVQADPPTKKSLAQLTCAMLNFQEASYSHCTSLYVEGPDEAIEVVSPVHVGRQDYAHTLHAYYACILCYREGHRTGPAEALLFLILSA